MASTSTATVYGVNRLSMDFGKFYQTSYLDMNGNVIKRGSMSSPNLRPSAGFHRPENFSYRKAGPKFGKAKKPGMLDLLRGGAPHSPTRRARSTDTSKSPERPADAEAIIKLSHYPSAQIKKDTPPPIEREDWPAPPATAVITKNLVRATFAKKYEVDSSEEEDENAAVDPKVQKELEEISKIQDSAMVKCIREDLAEQIQQDKKRLLDPRSASRTPSASKEPVQPPRFISPVNASPSRTLVERPRVVSESDAIKSPTKDKTDRPVIHGSSTSHKYRIKPGYSFGYVSKSLSSVPPGTPGAYVYDSFYNNHSDDDDDDEDFDIREMKRKMHVVDLVTRGENDEDDRDSVFESDPSLFTHVQYKKKSSSNISNASTFDGSPFLNASSFDYRKHSESVLTLWEELLFEPDEPIPYGEINLAAQNRRKGLSITNLEKYLTNEEFEQHLGTTREQFYKLPEFRRNDIKRKAQLF